MAAAIRSCTTSRRSSPPSARPSVCFAVTTPCRRDLIPGCLTVTVLRELIARSISHLRHMIRHGFADRDEVLGMLDAGAHPAGSDIQKRMLSDPYCGRNWTLFRRDWPPLEADALDRALAALSSIDVLGVTEAMGDHDCAIIVGR